MTVCAGKLGILPPGNNPKNQPFLQLLYLHVSLTDELRDANKVVVLEVEEGIWGWGVD